MITFIYPAKIKKGNDGFFLVTFPDIPFAATDGKNMKEALTEAEDCLEEAIAACINNNLSLPIPKSSSIEKGLYPISLSAQMSAKAALYIALKETNTSKSEFARKFGITEKEARRMLYPKHPTKIPRIEKALSMLGKKLIIGVEKAA